MIDFLRGVPVFADTDYVVLDVHGVGYRVFCANPYAVMAEGKQGEVTLYTHHHVREDAMQLYGFRTREEQVLFRRLLEVSGIGPKMAIGILSGGRPEELVQAIFQENMHYLTKLPGVGKKTAQRMILDLKDKLGDLPVSGDWMKDVVAGGRGLGQLRQEETTPWSEAKEALVALGYTEAELDRAWASIQSEAEGLSADQLIKLALKALYRG